jgi:hypothetical protein
VPETAFCTIATTDYLPMTSVLLDSIRANYGVRTRIFVLVLGGDPREPQCEGAIGLGPQDIPNPFYWDMLLRYDLTSIACAYKPLLLRHLLDVEPMECLFYLDSDTEIFAPFSEASELLTSANASVVVTPHALEARFLGRPIDDRSLLLAGTINSGFLGVNRTAEARKFLDWWAYLNRTECYTGGAYHSRDQKWLSLASSYFAGVRTLRHPGYNVGHFNLDERRSVLTDGRLRMLHYTYLHQLEWNVSSYLRAFEIEPDDAIIQRLTDYCARFKREPPCLQNDPTMKHKLAWPLT